MAETSEARAQSDGWLNEERLRSHVVAYVVVRILITTALLVILAALAFQDAGTQPEAPVTLSGLARLAALSYALWALSLFGLRARWDIRALAVAQLVFDAAIVTELVVDTRGVESLFGGLYIVSIVASAYLVNRQGTLVTSFVASGLITLIGVMGWGAPSILAITPGNVATQVLVRVFAFLLVGVLSSRLSEELRATGRALERETARSTALQEEFSRVVGLLRSGLATVGPSGELRSANPQALRLFPALARQPAREVIPGFSLDRRGVWEVTSGANPPRQILVAVTPLDDGGCVITLEDVTELRVMEREVQRQERLAAAGRFAAGVAHEVRNPLAALSSAVQMIEVNEQDRPLQDIILREVDRLDRLVTQFLETAEPPQPTLSPTDLSTIISDVATTFGRDRRFSGRVRLALQGMVREPVLADADQLRQVIWNLLLNAAQAMPAGGVVDIELEDRGDVVFVRVRDQGVGIPEAELGQIFDPFFSSRSGGTGLGLATVERVVREHGGTVRVESRVGEGSLFVITLPRVGGGVRAAMSMESQP